MKATWYQLEPQAFREAVRAKGTIRSVAIALGCTEATLYRIAAGAAATEATWRGIVGLLGPLPCKRLKLVLEQRYEPVDQDWLVLEPAESPSA